jgi:hypothetical protein
MLLTASLDGPEGQDPVAIDAETRRALESLGYVH